MDFYQEDGNLVRFIFGWITDIVVVLSLAWFCLYSFGGQITIVGQGMNPTLYSDDIVLTNQIVYQFSEPSRFDIIVFQWNDNKKNIKRVVGLPGETVQIKEGSLYIDGVVVPWEHATDKILVAGLAEYPIELGADEYFLLGDNTDNSEDSRFSNVGNVKKEQILGKIWIRIAPLIDFGFVS